MGNMKNALYKTYFLYLLLVILMLLNCFIISGMTSGAVGSVIGTPAEISLIRMTSDGR